MQVFQAPAMFLEFTGQPVEQLGVRDTAAGRTEVSQRRHQTTSKVMVPHAIGDHSRGEWILIAGEPACQLQAGCRGLASTMPMIGFAAQDFGRSGCDGNSRSVPPTSTQDS